METTERNKYWITQPGYKERLDNEAFDDTGLTDEFQKEVYEYAAQVYDRESGMGKVHGVIDVGCGSAYKLMKHFSDTWTLGIDTAPTVEWLKNTYKGRNWEVCNFSHVNAGLLEGSLVICSDVIEHIPDPDQMMVYLRRMCPVKLILSTPDRDLLPYIQADFKKSGPPVNPCHVREWNFKEFEAYVQQFFVMDAHFISNREQGTQVMLCSSL